MNTQLICTVIWGGCDLPCCLVDTRSPWKNPLHPSSGWKINLVGKVKDKARNGPNQLLWDIGPKGTELPLDRISDSCDSHVSKHQWGGCYWIRANGNGGIYIASQCIKRLVCEWVTTWEQVKGNSGGSRMHPRVHFADFFRVPSFVFFPAVLRSRYIWNMQRSKGNCNNWFIWYMICYILLTAIRLTPAGSSTVHIYTQTVHRTTQWNGIPRTEHT